MFVGQKASFETSCLPEFNLKTPNSPSIAQIASISNTWTNDTQFFSFLLHTSKEEMTPFRTSKDEQFSRNNSGRKLSIMEEEKTTEEAEIVANAIKALSPASSVDMDLTTPEGGIIMTPEDSPKSGEDVVKKVRFSDQYKTAAGEFGGSMESCVRTILNTSLEEEEFLDARDESNAQKAKATREDIKDTKSDTKDVEGAKSTEDKQAEGEKRPSTQPSGNCLSNSQIKIIQDNTKNVKKENRDPEASKEGALSANQRDSNRVLMMVLLESNSGGLTNDLVPLISSGLKKLQEQLVSVSPSSAAESAKVCRRSITTMKMSVSSVESYSTNSPATMTSHGSQLASSSSSSSVQNGENSNSGGFLSTIAQAMKHALRSFSGW